MSPDLLTTIGTAVVGAAVTALLFREFKQPPLLGYILGGVLLGPQAFGLVTDEHSVELISHVGLLLLLFIIGLEIDLPKLLSAGKTVTTLGLLQFPLSFALIYGLSFLPPFGFWTPMSRAYLAAGLSLSSTMIVVKLLHDKLEIGSFSGRVTVGVLVFQDVWAILLMAIQPSLGSPRWGQLLGTAAAGAALVVVATLAARTVIKRLFERVAMSPELTLMLAVAWCFGLAGAAGAAGLSREMGALIAGATLAPLPYASELVAKVGGIRDFFVCLFFVALGLQVPSFTLPLAIAAICGTAAVLLSRFGVVLPLMRFVGQDVRHGSVVAINLSQVSEFSLVLALLGVSLGHIDVEVASTILVTLLMTAVLATYLIKDNHRIAAALARLRGANASCPADGEASGETPDIFLLGFHRIAGSLLTLVCREAEDFRKRLFVVDFNPDTLKKLKKDGVSAVYGDISHAETLTHAGIKEATLVISSISDTYLKGTSNLRILRVVKRLAPQAKVIVTGESTAQAQQLYREGAALVILPRALAAQHLFDILTHDTLDALSREKRDQMNVLLKDDGTPASAG